MAMSQALVILPQVFQYIQVIGYVVMIFFFGSIAMRGWKGWLPWYTNLLARAGVGFLCLFVGVSIGPLITGLRSGILAMFQLDLITVGVVSAIMLSIALYLLSFKSHYAVLSIRKRMHKLERRMRSMRNLPKGMTIHKWIGVIIIVALVALAAVNFRGFPENPAGEIFRSMGLPEDIANMSPECMGAIMAMTAIDEVRNPPLYENPSLASLVEERSGKEVFEMYRLESEGMTVIAIKTTDDLTCFATESEFCMCPQ